MLRFRFTNFIFLCHKYSIKPGEFVAYRFYHTEEDISYYDADGAPVLIVNITVRAAAPGPRNLYFEIYDDTQSFSASGRKSLRGFGYHDFENVQWQNVQLGATNPHYLYVHFPAGNTNMCSVGISVERPQRLIPFTINALDYDRAREFDNRISGQCQDGNPPLDEPDTQNTDDEQCEAFGPCHVAFTQPWEFVEYDFDHSDEYITNVADGGSYVFVDITVRVASLEIKKFQIEISNGDTLGPIQIFEAPGKGWQQYEDVTWRMLALEPREGTSKENAYIEDVQTPYFISFTCPRKTGTHSILLAFVEGNINMCSISVEYSRYSPPITFAALAYFGAGESSPHNDQGGCNSRDDGVDVQPTSDEVCILRDRSICNVGWTDQGEYLEYKFYLPSFYADDYDIWVRVSSNRPGKRVRMELNPTGAPPYSQTFDVVSRGSWQAFTDIVWSGLFLQENEYTLRIYFETGQTNLCSVSILESTSRYYVFVPGTYSAMHYADFWDETPELIGNCPNTRQSSSVDALIATDLECVAARSEFEVACSIGWTDAGEYLTYQFKTDGQHEYVNISFRLSSASPFRRLQAEVYSVYGETKPTTTVPFFLASLCLESDFQDSFIKIRL